VRVAILVGSFDPDKGYLEYYLARELTKLNNDVKIFAFHRRGGFFESEVNGFNVVSVRSLFSIHSYDLFSARTAHNIIKIIKKDPPDIVHSQPLFSPLSLLFMSFDRAFNYKIVGSLLTGELFIGKLSSRLQFDFVRFLVTKYAARRAKMIFALSGDIKKILLGFFDTIPSEKIHLVPLGADHNLFRFNQEARQRVRASLGLSQNDLLIASPGKLIPEKSLGLLIKSVAPLKAPNGSLKLLFVGQGSSAYVDSLKRLAKSLKAEDRILFLPPVHRTKVPEYYSASDIAVFTASTISIIEAMSTGLPVIIGKSFVSKCELEYGNGFSYELRAHGGDLNALITYLQKLVSDPELRIQMGKRSRALVEDKLNWETIAKTYLNLYKRALEE